MPFSAVGVSLRNQETWQRMAPNAEMMVTKAGRRLLPGLELEISGLDPNSMYSFKLGFERAEPFKFKYENGHWAPGSDAEQFKTREFENPVGLQSGSRWMEDGINFAELKVTSSTGISDPSFIVLDSMHKYCPLVTITKVNGDNTSAAAVFSLELATFYAVTRHYNPQMIEMKAAVNKFGNKTRKRTRNEDAGQNDGNRAKRAAPGSLAGNGGASFVQQQQVQQPQHRHQLAQQLQKQVQQQSYILQNQPLQYQQLEQHHQVQQQQQLNVQQPINSLQHQEPQNFHQLAQQHQVQQLQIQQQPIAFHDQPQQQHRQFEQQQHESFGQQRQAQQPMRPLQHQPPQRHYQLEQQHQVLPQQVQHQPFALQNQSQEYRQFKQHQQVQQQHQDLHQQQPATLQHQHQPQQQHQQWHEQDLQPAQQQQLQRSPNAFHDQPPQHQHHIVQHQPTKQHIQVQQQPQVFQHQPPQQHHHQCAQQNLQPPQQVQQEVQHQPAQIDDPWQVPPYAEVPQESSNGRRVFRTPTLEELRQLTQRR